MKSGVLDLNEFEFFKKCIIGNFNNLLQIEEQLKIGKLIHPTSIHSSNICNDIIKNLPKNFSKTFILEKNYYTSYGDTINNSNLHHLYLLEQTKDKKIKMSFYEMKNQIIEKRCFSRSSKLLLDFKKLKLSQKLNPIIFEYKEKIGFYGKSHSILENNISLFIEKTIHNNKIKTKQVIKNGDKVIVGSDLPIIYKKEIISQPKYLYHQ